MAVLHTARRSLAVLGLLFVIYGVINVGNTTLHTATYKYFYGAEPIFGYGHPFMAILIGIVMMMIFSWIPHWLGWLKK